MTSVKLSASAAVLALFAGCAIEPRGPGGPEIDPAESLLGGDEASPLVPLPPDVDPGGDGKGDVAHGTMRLHVDGSKPGFVDAAGRAVWLTGIAVAGGPNGFPTYGWPWASGATMTQAAGRGANYVHFRLGPYLTVNMAHLPGCTVTNPDDETPDSFQPYALVGGHYDLGAFNQAYWDRLRTRIQTAAGLGMYVEIDLIDAWALKDDHRDCASGFDADNNVNGYDLTCDRLRLAPDATARAWLEKVADTVADLDNVIFQVGNETFLCPGGPGGAAPAWEAGVADIVRDRIAARGYAPQPIGTNGRRDDVRTSALDYIQDHGPRAIDLAAGKPSGVNEDDQQSTPDRWMREAWEGFSRGTWFHYWFGEDDAPSTVATTLDRMAAFRGFVNSVPFGQYRVLSQGVVGIGGQEWMAFSRFGTTVPPIDLGPQTRTFRVEWIAPRTGLVAQSSLFTGAGVQTFPAPTTDDSWALRVRVEGATGGPWEQDRFDELALGPLAGQNGWSGSPSAQVVAAATGKELVLDPPAGSAPIIMGKDVPDQTSGRHRLELRIRVDNPGAASLAKIEVDNNATTGWNKLFQIFAGTGIRLNYDPSGASVILVPTAIAGHSYAIRADFDLATGRLDAYVDGALVASGVQLTQADRRVGSLGLSAWDLAGRVVFDDIVGQAIASGPAPTVQITSSCARRTG